VKGHETEGQDPGKEHACSMDSKLPENIGR
jgi:hypothetical protein